MLKKHFRRKEDIKGEDAKCAIAVIVDDEEEMEGSDLHLIEIESKESVYDVNVNNDLEEHQKPELNNLLNKYDNVFTTIPGTTNLVKHSIKLTTDEPVVCKPYPLPFTSRNNLRVDFRKINKITLVDPEPMTTPDELFQKMTHAKYFTALDLSKGFWQVSMNEEDIKKTAFVTPDGHYEFLKMSFGLVNSSATLVKGLRDLFGDVNNVSFYVDDIIVYNDTFDDHMKTLEKVLCIIKKANIKLRSTKCHFIKEEI